MEEFRPQAERLAALTLINRQQLRADDFIEREGGATVRPKTRRPQGRACCLSRAQAGGIATPTAGGARSVRLDPLIQARLCFARAIRGEPDADGQPAIH